MNVCEERELDQRRIELQDGPIKGRWVTWTGGDFVMVNLPMDLGCVGDPPPEFLPVARYRVQAMRDRTGFTWRVGVFDRSWVPPGIGGGQ